MNFVFVCQAVVLAVSLLITGTVCAQGPGSRGGPGGFGRGPGNESGELKLLDRFDADQNKWLDAAEREKARPYVAEIRSDERQRRRGGFRARGENLEPAKPGPRLTPDEVEKYSDAPLYDLQTLRTLFFEFENLDWEKELDQFYNTDVEVPAKLTVDDKVYPNVGVRFRGASSFFTVPEGRKRSLNVSVDMANEEQRLGGYRTLELLNSHTDPSFLRTVLFFHVARQYIPAPKANFARVVINGESWGIYVNSQQFNKDFIRDNFATTGGQRWKAPGSPRGRAGLEYLGDDIAEYKRYYEIKTKDDPEFWRDFIQLCRVLSETPAEQLEAALSPILNVNGALKFLALQNVFINNDGYWIRSSDFNLYRNPQGQFNLIPHDANETFRAAGGPGWFGGSAGDSGLELDPLTGVDDPAKPLLSKLLGAPSLRTRYLGLVREIAENWLDWERLHPIAAALHALIEDDVKADTRKLSSYAAFKASLTGEAGDQASRGSRRAISLKEFCDERRAYLLEHTAE